MPTSSANSTSAVVRAVRWTRRRTRCDRHADRHVAAEEEADPERVHASPARPASCTRCPTCRSRCADFTRSDEVPEFFGRCRWRSRGVQSPGAALTLVDGARRERGRSRTRSRTSRWPGRSGAPPPPVPVTPPPPPPVPPRPPAPALAPPVPALLPPRPAWAPPPVPPVALPPVPALLPPRLPGRRPVPRRAAGRAGDCRCRAGRVAAAAAARPSCRRSSFRPRRSCRRSRSSRPIPWCRRVPVVPAVPPDVPRSSGRARHRAAAAGGRERRHQGEPEHGRKRIGFRSKASLLKVIRMRCSIARARVGEKTDDGP